MITKTNLFLLAIVSLTFGCNQPSSKEADTTEDTTKVEFEDKQFPPVVKAKDLKTTVMVPTMQSKLDVGKNVIYATAFLYAWDEVSKILGPLTVKEDKYSDFYLVNSSKSHAGTLQKDEYSASAFDGGDGVVATASFKKLLPFEHKMTKYASPFMFGKDLVQGFGLNYHDEDNVKKQVEILYYNSDDDFVIRIAPKDTSHEIVLIKSPVYGSSFDSILKETNRKTKQGNKDAKTKNNSWKYTINEDDVISIPAIRFNVETNYDGLEGHTFYDRNNESHLLNTAYQRTALIFDEEGAIVESFAYASADSVGVEIIKIEPKHMLFNKPFVMILKRKNSANPYFALMVSNAELLVPFEK